ncbi:iron-sulfur cluster assembly protein [Saccharomonospora sp. NPDC046836]|uniref:metal-sulfur cluster assembly factor n=1 Tax=Saccharomonospora sp. NPDC046836 TaxID=3156921 RepID=UPI0033F936EC
MTSALPSHAEVLAALEDVIDPCSVATGMPLSLPGMGLVKDIEIESGTVTVHMRLSSPGCYMLGFFTDEITDRVTRLRGITSVKVTFDEGLDWDPSFIRAEEAQRRRRKFLALEVAARVARRAPV